MTSSLKSRRRDKRNKGFATRYKVADDTNVENISLKVLLSHIETKKDLTAFVSEKVVTGCEETKNMLLFM